jgi:hypothetical protein
MFTAARKPDMVAEILYGSVPLFASCAAHHPKHNSSNVGSSPSDAQASTKKRGSACPTEPTDTGRGRQIAIFKTSQLSAYGPVTIDVN